MQSPSASSPDQVRNTSVARPSTMRRAAADLRGVMVGGYRIVQELARGGMGVVYLAAHPVLGRKVAVKVLNEDFAKDPAIARRFEVEARAGALVHHMNFVGVLDLTTLPDGRPCIVMEYARGESLEERVAAKGRLSPAEALPILLQLCNALSAAHAAGIVHGDIKPDNIVLVNQGGRADVVKLIDFGIAQIGNGPAVPLPDVLAGTPGYMAPEQVLGHTVDPRTDLYSVGVVAFRLLTGRLPFQGRSASAVMMSQVRDTPVLPPEVPAPLAKVVLRALSKSRSDRQATATELWRDLKRCANELRTERSGVPAVQSAPPPVPSLAAARAGSGAQTRFEVEVRGATVTARFASQAEFERVQRAELVYGRLFVPTTADVGEGPIILVVEVAGSRKLERRATLSARVSEAEAREWSISPGVLLDLKRPPQVVESTHRAGSDRIAQEILRRFAMVHDLDHYAFIDVDRSASLDAIDEACERAECDLTRARSFASPEQLKRIEVFLGRLERARVSLLDVERRARYDATLGNFAGVERAIDDGLPQDRLLVLHDEFCARHAERVRAAADRARAADLLEREGKLAQAFAVQEQALHLLPLSPSLHAHHRALRSRLKTPVPAARQRPVEVLPFSLGDEGAAA